jgi:recombination protein RecA
MSFRTSEKSTESKLDNKVAKASTGEKAKALDLAVSAIEKQFGKGSIMRLGTNEALYKDVTAISTGALSLDLALGIGGLPRGRIVEIYGPESSGKTTLALTTIAQAQKLGGVVAFVDAEHALDIGYARKLGVNTEDLLISQPDTGEQALEITETLVRSGAIDVLVIDSVAALVPRAEIEGDMGDSHVGLQARLMSQALRKLTAAISRSKTMVIFINQIRMKIGVMFGNPETTTGGNALKFYASVRLDVRRIGAIKNGEDVVGNRTAVKVVKNKMAPPFGKVEFDLMYGEGISYEGDLLDLATKYELVDKSGAWFSINGERMGQGRDQAKNFLKEHPEICKELHRKILELNKIGAITPVSLAATDDADDGGEIEGKGKEALSKVLDEKMIDKKVPAMAAAKAAPATASAKVAASAATSTAAAAPAKAAAGKAQTPAAVPAKKPARAEAEH